jgi:hypothetical protein
METEKELQYLYEKHCKICGEQYFQNKISKDVFENAADNPALQLAFNGDKRILIMESHCNNCIATFNN